MKIRDNKGSITVFVLVGLLFMTGFLIISFGSNINKSKSAEEQFNIISSIYSHGDGDTNAYDRAYTAIRRRNAQILIESSENSSTLELTKTFTDTLSDYKIYGNSVQNGTPRPTNPVEIQSVGDKTKNLFNANAIANTDIQVLDNGKNIVMPVATAGNGITSTQTKLSVLCPDLKVGDIVILNFESNTMTNPYIYLNTSDVLWVNKKTQTITQEMLNSTVCLYANRYSDGDTVQRTISNLQIEYGTSATEYMPYDKYRVKVKVSKEKNIKNLFNANGIVNTNIQVTDNGRNIVMPIATSGNGYTTTTAKLSELCPDLRVGDVVILSFKSNTSTNPMIYLEGIADLWYRNTTRTITQDMLDSIVVLYGNRYMDGDTTQKTITDFQIEKGTVATEYQPYVESQSFNIYLDEPLRKIGNYADYIDFETGKVHRNVLQRVLNGTEYWELVQSTFVIYFNDVRQDGKYKESQIVYSNSYMGDTNRYRDEMKDKTIVKTMVPATQVGIKDSSYTTLDEFKAFLASNPITIQYVLATTDDTETIDLPNLSTYEDYTKIEVLTEVAPSKIEATYYGYTME